MTQEAAELATRLAHTLLTASALNLLSFLPSSLGRVQISLQSVDSEPLFSATIRLFLYL